VQAALVPELYVSDLDASLTFYARFGFVVRYARPAERFAYLAREEAELMLEEPSGAYGCPRRSSGRSGAA
jgi:catechol 2,3-dioxygenase-like lactoylglutathione lyase family enzyme